MQNALDEICEIRTEPFIDELGANDKTKINILSGYDISNYAMAKLIERLLKEENPDIMLDIKTESVFDYTNSKNVRLYCGGKENAESKNFILTTCDERLTKNLESKILDYYVQNENLLKGGNGE